MSMSKMSRLEVSTLKGGAYLTIQTGRTNARTQMSVDPRAQSPRTSLNYNFNDATKRTNQGFRFASNAKERVQDALRENSRLEPSPTKLCDGNTQEKLMNLRPRQPSKEINPIFRYKSNNYIEKITSVIHSRNAGNSYKESEAFSSKIKNKYGTLAKNLIPINNMTIIDQEERSKKSRSGAKTP